MIGRIAWRTLPPPSVHSVTSGASSSISSLMSPPVDGGEEPLGGFALLDAVGLEPGAPGLDVFAGAVCGLTHRGLGTFDGVADFGVAEVEHLLEHEHGALQRAEGLQHDEHRHRHRFGGGDVIGGVGLGEDRLRKPWPHIGFALVARRAKPLHRQVRHDAGEVGLRVGDL